MVNEREIYDNNVDAAEMSRCQINQSRNEPNHVPAGQYLRISCQSRVSIKPKFHLIYHDMRDNW